MKKSTFLCIILAGVLSNNPAKTERLDIGDNFDDASHAMQRVNPQISFDAAKAAYNQSLHETEDDDRIREKFLSALSMLIAVTESTTKQKALIAFAKSGTYHHLQLLANQRSERSQYLVLAIKAYEDVLEHHQNHLTEDQIKMAQCRKTKLKYRLAKQKIMSVTSLLN